MYRKYGFSRHWDLPELSLLITECKLLMKDFIYAKFHTMGQYMRGSVVRRQVCASYIEFGCRRPYAHATLFAKSRRINIALPSKVRIGSLPNLLAFT
jgi:hypothetical protein